MLQMKWLNTDHILARMESPFHQVKTQTRMEQDWNALSITTSCAYLRYSSKKNPEDRITWYSNDKKTKKIIDHVIASPEIQKTMSDCGVKKELDFSSDHRCVTASIKTPSSSQSQKKKYKPYQSKEPNKKDPKRDFSQLDNEKVSKTYIAEVEKLLKDNERYTPDTTSTPHDKASSIEKQITKAMEDAATSTLPTITKDNKCKHEIFRDDAIISDLIAKCAKATVNDKEKKGS